MKKRKIQKTKTPYLDVNKFMSDSLELYIYSNLVNAIESNISGSNSPVFKIRSTQYSISLEKNEWKSALSKALHFFEKESNFEQCIKVRDLLNKI